MIKWGRSWFANNQDIVVVNLILLVKVCLLTYIIGYNPQPFWLVVTTTAILMLMSYWLVILPNIMRIGVLLLYDLAISLLLIADAMFVRFFHRVMPMPAIFQVNQLQGISQSVVAGLKLTDCLFALDLVLIVPYLAYVYMRLKGKPVRFRSKVLQMLLVLLVSFGLIGAGFGNIAKSKGQEYLASIDTNSQVLNTMGVLDFHLLDTYNNFFIRKDTHLSKEESLAFRGWMVSHQAKTSLYNGAAKGKNLIMVQLESTQQFLIGRSINGQTITPNLNKLMQSSMYFNNIYAQVGQGNSSDAEFMSLNSLYPQGIGVNFTTYPNNTYQALPKLLKGKNYATLAIHGDVGSFWGRDKIYPNLGIDKFYSRSTLTNDEIIGMGLSDKSVFGQAVSIIENTREPFMSLVISLSGHYPYVIPAAQQSLNIPKGEYSEVFTNYLQSQHYMDAALGQFIEKLKNDGILNDSILVVYGDHFGLGWQDDDITKFMGSTNQGEFAQADLRKVPLFIRLPEGENAGVKQQVGGQMDIFPTLANLLGLDKQQMFYFGQDLLNQSNELVALRYYEPNGSFVSDKFIYLANWDGVFEHGTAFARSTGEKVDVTQCKAQYEEAKRQLNISDKVLQSDALSDLITQPQH